MMTIEDFDKIEQKYVLQCKKCGHMFVPWKTLMVTLPQNNMRPYLYCPQCKNYDDKEAFKIN